MILLYRCTWTPASKVISHSTLWAVQHTTTIRKSDACVLCKGAARAAYVHFPLSKRLQLSSSADHRVRPVTSRAMGLLIIHTYGTSLFGCSTFIASDPCGTKQCVKSAHSLHQEVDGIFISSFLSIHVHVHVHVHLEVNQSSVHSPARISGNIPHTHWIKTSSQVSSVYRASFK